jgi:hypothetical protein
VTTNVTDPASLSRRNRAVGPATTKLAHSTSGASATAGAPTVPAVVFCTSVRPAKSRVLSRPGEFTAPKPAAGAPSFNAGQPGWRCFGSSASLSVEAGTIFSTPREKAQAATVKARMSR